MANKEVRICENCGTKNPVCNLECVKCGYDLSFVIPTMDEEADIELQSNPVSKKSEWILIAKDNKDYVVNINGEMMIGREDSPISDFLNRSKYISRNHAKLFIENEELYVIDASTNGTFVNDRKIDKMQKIKLNCGDFLRFADITFVVGNSYAD